MCAATENRQKLLKPRSWEVQGRSRSLMLIPLDSSSAVLVMIGSKSVPTSELNVGPIF